MDVNELPACRKCGKGTMLPLSDYGRDGAPITFKANEGVVIASRNAKTADGIDIEGASYIVIDGFTITNSSPP